MNVLSIANRPPRVTTIKSLLLIKTNNKQNEFQQILLTANWKQNILVFAYAPAVLLLLPAMNIKQNISLNFFARTVLI